MFETGGSGQTVCRSCPHTLTTRDGKQRQQGSWNSGADPEASHSSLLMVLSL